jgi:hypothetical protein
MIVSEKDGVRIVRVDRGCLYVRDLRTSNVLLRIEFRGPWRRLKPAEQLQAVKTLMEFAEDPS